MAAVLGDARLGRGAVPGATRALLVHALQGAHGRQGQEGHQEEDAEGTHCDREQVGLLARVWR